MILLMRREGYYGNSANKKSGGLVYIRDQFCHPTNSPPFSVPPSIHITLMEEDDGQRELQLLPAISSTHRSGGVPAHSRRFQAMAEPSLDLQLSISIGSLRPSLDCIAEMNSGASSSVEAMKQHAADQIRLAAAEKAYAERVRELTRREIELAESEFARARHMWERAREEVEKAERMKEKAIRRIGSTCTEITCQACRQRFRP